MIYTKNPIYLYTMHIKTQTNLNISVFSSHTCYKYDPLSDFCEIFTFLLPILDVFFFFSSCLSMWEDGKVWIWSKCLLRFSHWIVLCATHCCCIQISTISILFFCCFYDFLFVIIHVYNANFCHPTTLLFAWVSRIFFDWRLFSL